MLARRNENYLPSFFERFLNNDLSDWNLTNFSGTNTSLPAVNVKETNDEFIIELAAPGMEKKDFKINFKNNVITISSEREDKKEEKKDNYTRREFSYQSFQRSFTVPENAIISDKIEAAYKNGILDVTIPKKEAEEKLARVINIQ